MSDTISKSVVRRLVEQDPDRLTILAAIGQRTLDAREHIEHALHHATSICTCGRARSDLVNALRGLLNAAEEVDPDD